MSEFDRTVTLRAITKENLHDILRLQVVPHQAQFVASNAVSLAEAHFEPDLPWFRAVYAGDVAVDFLMLEYDSADKTYNLWRFMIDAHYQGLGYGRRALELLFAHLKTLPGAAVLYTHCGSAEGGPGPFYEKMGFVYTGEEKAAVCGCAEPCNAGVRTQVIRRTTHSLSLSPSPSLNLGGSMKRVTGIGGIFFKAKDAPARQAWYKQHLGIDVQEWGGTAFTWTDGEGKPAAGTTIWSIGSAEGDHFAPSTATFIINYRVEDLHAQVKVLREEGCNVLEQIDESDYGKFAWVIDPEGNKVELWQPPAGQ